MCSQGWRWLILNFVWPSSSLCGMNHSFTHISRAFSIHLHPITQHSTVQFWFTTWALNCQTSALLRLGSHSHPLLCPTGRAFPDTHPTPGKSIGHLERYMWEQGGWRERGFCHFSDYLGDWLSASKIVSSSPGIALKTRVTPAFWHKASHLSLQDIAQWHTHFPLLYVFVCLQNHLPQAFCFCHILS